MQLLVPQDVQRVCCRVLPQTEAHKLQVITDIIFINSHKCYIQKICNQQSAICKCLKLVLHPRQIALNSFQWMVVPIQVHIQASLLTKARPLHSPGAAGNKKGHMPRPENPWPMSTYPPCAILPCRYKHLLNLKEVSHSREVSGISICCHAITHLPCTPLPTEYNHKSAKGTGCALRGFLLRSGRSLGALCITQNTHKSASLSHVLTS